MPDISKAALIIGVDAYSHKRSDGMQSLISLPSCKRDALDLYEVLKDYGYIIYGGAPLLGSGLPEGEGYKKIQETAKNFFQDAEAGQTLVFYFSGHGITNRGQVYLATPEVDPLSPMFIGLNLLDLAVLINNSRSTRIVCIIDACYSGAANLSNPNYTDKAAAESDADEAVGIYDKIKENIPIAEGKSLLLSSQAYQRSKAEENNNSVYTKYLIIGLKGTKLDLDEKGIPIPSSVDEFGNVTPQTLHEFVYNRVANELKTQTPRIKSSLSSKIVLVKHPRLATGKLVETSTRDPDITIYIYRTNTDYDVLLSSSLENLRYNLAPMGRISLRDDAQNKFLAIFEDIDKVPAQQFRPHMEAIGLSLYSDLFPSELKSLYWKIRGRLKSIWIISDEPWIPWEIIKPWRRLEDGKIEEDAFLCERYTLSRWLRGTPYFTLSKIVNKVSIVVPSDTPLSGAIKERDWIKYFGEKFGLETTVNSTFEEVYSALKIGGFDILHFSTNGRYRAEDPFLSTIELENNAEIRPRDIVGPYTTFGQSNPLVFMNTCQSSTQGFSINGVQGWVKRFLDAGASAFIGTIWSVSDDTAFKFSQEFYLQLANGTPLGEAVQKSTYKM